MSNTKGQAKVYREGDRVHRTSKREWNFQGNVVGVADDGQVLVQWDNGMESFYHPNGIAHVEQTDTLAPGQESRGDAALREAIATGSPVPTNAGQAGELATTTFPAMTTSKPMLSGSGDPNDWACVVTSNENGHELTVFGDSAEDATKRAHLFAAAPFLHAYAKARHLYAVWIASGTHRNHVGGRELREAFENQLHSMGWQNKSDGADSEAFLIAYGAAALAKAGGK